MSALFSLARPEILALSPYAHAAWRPGLTRLHANEAPWRPAGDTSAAGLNRYPEPQPAALIERLAALYGVEPRNLLVGRGSDEAIDALSRIFLRAGQDAILQCPPTFGMYSVAARIQGAAVIDCPLRRENGWRLDAEALLAAWRPEMKLVYLCSPNNPTGNRLAENEIAAVCDALDGRAVVVIDEAYVEWSGAASLAAWIERYRTLAVLRTLSKAHALAGARIGALIGPPELIEIARRVVPPYALAQPAIEAALAALAPEACARTDRRIAELLRERERLHRALEASPLVERVWPSAANFLLADCTDAGEFLRRGLAGGLIVRDLRGQAALAGSLRVTVGERAQNDALIASLANGAPA
ncbi:MAG: histidinol-phosphate transaminase [Gammaproteobacteria bacterium]|nr:histidinol-phosphate transaminase [Gammaproteobacteria bacterium]